MIPASKDHPDTWQWVAWDDLRNMQPQTTTQGIARIVMARAIGLSDFIEYLYWLNIYLHNT